MKAMMLEHVANVESDPLQLQEVSEPDPGPRYIRVKVLVCGVCRTDLHIVEGELPLSSRPIIPGHETVGIVDRVGPGVTKVKEGDRVGIAWLQGICGQCEFCHTGRENLCGQATFSGYHVHGGYAEYAVVSEDFAYPIPQNFSDAEAAPLLCAGIIGYRALRRSHVRPGERLGIYGFGASAHITIQVARHWGCEVYVCSLRENHRALATHLGAVWVGTPTEGLPDKMHGSIVFAPVGELVPSALRSLQKGGTLALAGIYMTPIPSLNYDLDLFQERTLQSVTANTKQDGLDLLQEAAAIPIRTTIHSFPLEDANLALQQLKAGTINGAGVLTIG